MNFECISVNKLMVTTAKFSQNFPHTERCSTSSSPRQFLLHNSKEPLTNPYFLVQNFQTKIAPKTISKLSTHADSISGLESSKTIKNFPNLSQSRRSLQHKSTNSPSVDPKNRKSDPSAHAITTKTIQKNPDPQKDQKPRKKPIPPNLKEITLASLLKDINSSEDEVEGTKEEKQPMAKSRAANKLRVRIPSLRTDVLEKPLRADSSNISPLPSTFRKDSPSAPKNTNMMFLNYGNENATLVLKDQVPKSSPRVAFAESTGQLADVHALQRKNKPALITKLNIEGGKKERSPSISPKVTIKKEPHTPGRYLTTNYQTKSIRPLTEANEESLSPVQPRMSAPKTASATYRQKNLGRKKSLEIEQAESSYQIKQKFLRSFSGKIFPMQEDEDNPASSYALLSDRGPETQEKYPTSIENIIADSRHSVSRRVRLLTTTVEKGSEEAQARLPGSETIKKYFPGAELVQRTSLKKKSVIKTNPENRSVSQINRPTERKRTTAFIKVGSKIMDPEQPSNNKEKELFVFNPPSNPIFHKKFGYNAKIKRDIANIKKFVGQFQHKTDYKSLRIKLKEALNFLSKVKLNPKELLRNKIFSVYPFEKKHSEKFLQACKAGRIDDAIDYLAKNRYLVFDFDNVHMTALHWAAKRGDVELANAILEYGADVDAKDIIGRPPLYFAIKENHLEVFKVLLFAQCDPWSTDDVNYDQLTKDKPDFRYFLRKARQLHIAMQLYPPSVRVAMWKKDSLRIILDPHGSESMNPTTA